MGLGKWLANGEGPAAKAEQAIPRRCGMVVDHGNYGERCFKTAGHDGRCEGTFIEESELEQLRRQGLIAWRESVVRGEALYDGPITPGKEITLVEEGDPIHTVVRQALSPITAQLAVMNARFERFESNVHQLNLVAGELVNKVLTPLKGELEQLRYNLGDKANSTVSMLERLVTHVDRQLDIALKMTGATPNLAQRYRDEHGCHGDVPSIDELTATGVKAPLASTEEMLRMQLEAARAEVAAVRRENERLKACGYGD